MSHAPSLRLLLTWGGEEGGRTSRLLHLPRTLVVETRKRGGKEPFSALELSKAGPRKREGGKERGRKE